MKTIRLIAITLSAALLLSACGLFPPVPGDEQITGNIMERRFILPDF